MHSAKRRCVQMWRQMHLRALKKRTTPQELVFFVTSKCNAKCKHCFLWRDLNADKDIMNLEQIETLASSLVQPTKIGFTGGEPFLRKELPEIAKIFNTRAKASSLAITTHGGDPDLIVDRCEKILRDCKLYYLHVVPSILGLEETHDKIRGVPGKFQTAIKTIEGLVKIRKTDPTLHITNMTVITRDNYNEIEKIVKLLQSYNIGITFSFIRGKYSTFNLPESIDDCHTPNNEEEQILPLERMEEMYKKLCDLNDAANQKFFNIFQKAHMKASINIIRNKKQIHPCYAGYFSGIIYPNGDMSVCEQAKSFGNLSETNYDLGKLWRSTKANNMRKMIKKCSCIYACALNTSLSTKAWLQGE